MRWVERLRRWRTRKRLPPETRAGGEQTPREQLAANPTQYGCVGNGRMAIPLATWLGLEEAFGADNVGLYDAAGNSVDTDAQVAEIIDSQLAGPLLTDLES